ncbi:MAG: restriction endonuclease subunit S [Rhodoglobus sp.]
MPSLEYFKKQVFSKDLSKYKVMKPGTFAYATIHLDEGSVGIAPVDCLISPMYTAFEIDHSRVLPEFLIRLLKSPAIVARYSALGRGTAERRRSISLDALGSLSISLPPLPEQRRIAHLLDEVEEIRRSRGRARDQLSGLVDAAFAGVGAGATDLPLSDVLIEIQSGSSPVAANVPAEPGQWGVLKLGAVSSGAYKPEENKALLDGTEPIARHEVRRGDVLLARKNTPELVGASTYVAQTPDRLLLPDLVFRLVPRPEVIEPRFLQAALSTQQARLTIKGMSGGSAASMSNVSKRRLMTLRVSVPGLDEQRKFVTIVESVERLRAKEDAHSAKLDELFASLQYRAFRGEL